MKTKIATVIIALLMSTVSFSVFLIPVISAQDTSPVSPFAGGDFGGGDF